MSEAHKELEKQLTDLKQKFAAYQIDIEGNIHQLDRRVTLLERRLIDSLARSEKFKTPK